MRPNQLRARRDKRWSHHGVCENSESDQREARQRGHQKREANPLGNSLKPGRQEGERGKLRLYLPGLQRDALWVESVGLGQESDSSVI